MTTGIPIASLTGVINATLKRYPRKGYEQTYKFSSYPMLNLWQARKKAEMGSDINWVIRNKAGSNVRATRVHGTDSINIVDNGVTAALRPIFFDTHYAFDGREQKLNSGKAEQIYDVVKMRRDDEMEGLGNWLEAMTVFTPQDANSDLTMAGLPTWLRFKSGAITPGFVADTVYFLDGTSSTTYAGVNSATAGNERLKNWAFNHTNKIDADFVRNFEEAMIQTGVTPPVTMKGSSAEYSEDFRVFCPTSMLLQYNSYLDRLGANFKANGNTSIRNVQWTNVPALDKESSSDTHVVRAKVPVFCANLTKFDFSTVSDLWMRESGAREDPNNHHGVVVWVDSGGNIKCRNMRNAGFVSHVQF